MRVCYEPPPRCCPPSASDSPAEPRNDARRPAVRCRSAEMERQLADSAACGRSAGRSSQSVVLGWLQDGRLLRYAHHTDWVRVCCLPSSCPALSCPPSRPRPLQPAYAALHDTVGPRRLSGAGPGCAAANGPHLPGWSVCAVTPPGAPRPALGDALHCLAPFSAKQTGLTWCQFSPAIR